MSDIATNEAEDMKNKLTSAGVSEDSFLLADINVEEQGFGSAYPTMIWYNGDPAKKAQGGIGYTGGFFIAADAGVEKPAGFEDYTLITGEGEEIAGFAAKDVVMTVIRYRRCWIVKNEGALPVRFGWNAYEEAQEYGKARGTAHVLAKLEGSEDIFLVTFVGMAAKAMLGQGKERGVLPTFGNSILTAATRVATKKMKEAGVRGKPSAYPLCAFKIQIGPQSENGAPVFTKVGKGSDTSMITLPTWTDQGNTPTVPDTEIQRRFVGNAMLSQLQEIHREAEGWVAAWDPETLAQRNQRGQRIASPIGSSATPDDNKAPF